MKLLDTTQKPRKKYIFSEAQIKKLWIVVPYDCNMIGLTVIVRDCLYEDCQLSN